MTSGRPPRPAAPGHSGRPPVVGSARAACCLPREGTAMRIWLTIEITADAMADALSAARSAVTAGAASGCAVVRVHSFASDRTRPTSWPPPPGGAGGGPASSPP